jgi:DNA-binding YbaB/EbfC family protein
MNIQKMMKQMQQMQSQMQKSQAELAARSFDASVAGGKVSVTANGHGDIQSIKIAKEIVDPSDVEMLEDLVLSAIQQLQKKIKDTQNAEMGKLTGGLGLPPGLGL